MARGKMFSMAFIKRVLNMRLKKPKWVVCKEFRVPPSTLHNWEHNGPPIRRPNLTAVDLELAKTIPRTGFYVPTEEEEQKHTANMLRAVRARRTRRKGRGRTHRRKFKKPTRAFVDKLLKSAPEDNTMAIVEIPRDLFKRIQHQAIDEDRTPKAIIVEVLEEEITTR